MAQSWVVGDSRNLEIPRAHRPGLALCAHRSQTLDPTAPLHPPWAVYPQVISQTLPPPPCLQPGGVVGKLASRAGLAKGRICTWARRAQRDSFLENPFCLVQSAAPSLLPQCPRVEFLIPHSPPTPAQQGPGENLSTSSQECSSGIRGKETVRSRWPKRITSQGLSLKRYPTQKKPSAKPSLCPAEPVLGSRMNNGFVSCRILSYDGVTSVRGTAAVCFLCFPLIGLETGEQPRKGQGAAHSSVAFVQVRPAAPKASS